MLLVIASTVVTSTTSKLVRLFQSDRSKLQRRPDHSKQPLILFDKPGIIKQTMQEFENNIEFWKHFKQQLAEETSQSASRNPLSHQIEDWWKDRETDYESIIGFKPENQTRDIQETLEAIEEISHKFGLETRRAADCGAGVGRVTKEALVKVFDKVDVYERSEKLLDAAKQNLHDNPHVGDFVLTDLVDLEFTHDYDLILVNGVLGYLDEAQVVGFLQKARRSLRAGGVFFLKEQVATRHAFIFDSDAVEMFRSLDFTVFLFELAGFELIYTAASPVHHWARSEVRTMVFRPKSI